jgi:peptide/nickel transport system substrate-binding protein
LNSYTVFFTSSFKATLFIFFIFVSSTSVFSQNEPVTIAISDKFSGLDTLASTSPDAAAERLRNLIFDSLVKRNDKFEYVGDFAKEIKIDYKSLTITFILHDKVKFHKGKVLTSADAKYTHDAFFKANGYKAGSFFETVDGVKQPHILSVETPDSNTLVLKVRRVELINQTLSSLSAIPIIPEGSLQSQNENPIGTGAFKFVSFDKANSLVELEANQNYWHGSPKIKKVIIKTVGDANSLRIELSAGRIDVVVNSAGFSAESIKELSQNNNLQVVQTEGSNIRYIAFNVKAKTVKNAKLRQAIAFAIDREKIINVLLNGQATIAHSVLPEQSWAYSTSFKYEFNLEKAKRLLKESFYKGQIIKFKIAAGNQAVSQYAQVILESLKQLGINIEIETLELNTLFDHLRQGNFQMTTSQWAGGNQDPIFLRDLFQTNESPEMKPSGRNRSRYSNVMFDKAIESAVNATDKMKAKDFYANAQNIVANDLPYVLLWYPKNIVVANKRIGNLKIDPSGDLSFVKNLTLVQN